MRNVHRDRTNAVRPRQGGFTLVELLVVVVIVILVSAVTLPTIIPAIQNRQVSEAARVLQAALAGARDAAIRANAPRGIRLIPDPTLTGAATGVGSLLTASRMIQIEPAPDLTDGLVTFPPLPSSGATIVTAWSTGTIPRYPFPLPTGGGAGVTYPPYPAQPVIAGGPTTGILMVMQGVFTSNSAPFIPAPPTNWFWNVRIGDRIRFHDSGRYYTVIGPMTVNNPELFVNDGSPGTTPTLVVTYPVPGGGTNVVNPEFLFLSNGDDDDGNGYPDQGLDGVDNDLDGIADNINEWIGTTPGGALTGLGAEVEAWLGSQASQSRLAVPPVLPYTIARRPVPSTGAREVSLPSATVIDLTTWDTTEERSRLLVNPFNRTVDILLNQAGEIVPTTEFSNPTSFPMGGAFYHFWIADRTDVYPPTGTSYPSLPMPDGFLPPPTPTLKRDRRLVTLFSRTGHVVTNSIENFNTADPNAPYRDAQLGIREAK